MADQRITALLPLAEADVQAAADVLPVADVSTNETKKVSPAALVGAAVRVMAPGTLQGTLITAGTIGTAQLADGAVVDAKIAGPIAGGKLAADSITAREIAIDAITASELADGAVNTAAVQDAAITNAKLAAGIDGAKLTAGTVGTTQLAANTVGAAQLADGAVDTAAIQDGAVVAAKVANGAVGTTQLADLGVTTGKLADGAVTGPKLTAGAVDDSKISDVSPSKLGTANAGAVLAGPTTGTAAAVAFRALQGSDLPVATGSAVGGVKVPAAGGLSVAADGALSIGSAVAAGSGSVVTFNAFGQVTSGRALTGADLPLATSAAVGGVKPGAGLGVDGAGALGIANAVTAAEHPVISYDAQGLVTGGRALTAADIPEVDAAKIATGVLPAGRIGDGSITRQMLADYSITFIQEGAPPLTGTPIGTMWLQESTGALKCFNGNSFFPVGFGRLSAENLRYCGTFNAATGLVTGVTQFGTTEGLTIGGALPTASDKHAGVYLVASVPGNGTTVAPGLTFDNGDWILCQGATGGWVRIDTLSSGSGGGGGAGHLDDLLDVTLTLPATDDLLQFTASGQWVNVKAIDGGSF